MGRSLRIRGEGRLLHGRRAEDFTASEVPDDERPPILRADLERWKWEVGQFFDGVGPDATDDELRRIAPDHPIFRITDPFVQSLIRAPHPRWQQTPPIPSLATTRLNLPLGLAWPRSMALAQEPRGRQSRSRSSAPRSSAQGAPRSSRWRLPHDGAALEAIA